MQSPHNINLRSHHSLKSSAINEQTAYHHMNPLSSRLGSSKKISVNSKGDISCNTPTMKHQISLQSNNNELKIPWPTTGSNGHGRNDLFITLGNRAKEGHSSINQNSATDIQSKIQHILVELDRQNKRLGILQCRTNQNHMIKQQVISKLNMHRNSIYLQPNDIKTQILNLKMELNRATDTKSIDRRIDICELQSKQAIQTLKNSIAGEVSRLDHKMQQLIKKQIQAVTMKLEQKLEMFQQSVSEYLQKIKPREDKENDSIYFSNGGFAQKLIPLLKNPNLRLKFISRVSLVEKNSGNPENEGDVDAEEWEVETCTQTYMVDEEGYLLDEAQRYIIDSSGRCIKLSTNQIKSLKGLKVLQ